jgi:Protein of unknown function (DUF3500)
VQSGAAATIERPRRAPPPVDLATVSPGLRDMVANWQRLFAESFRGVTTDGQVAPELFRLGSEGASTRPMLDAVRSFRATLSPSQQQRVSFNIDDRGWRAWSNIHRNIMRHGLCLPELSDDQRAAALGLVRASVSTEAFDAIINAMRLNEYLAELVGRPDEYGYWFCWLSVFGTPSEHEPWGWQLDGHHININCFILGDQMVLTPMLLGAEPVLAESGAQAGATVLRKEEAAGWNLMQALAPAQRARATIGMELPFDGFGSGFKDNLQMPFQGVCAAEFDPHQRGLLDLLIRQYVNRLPDDHAAIKLAEVEAHLRETYFAWIGCWDETSPFYYRLHSPVIYIEFYHQPGVALPNTGYSRRHAHGLVRTPNGNDYGRALLQQHRGGAVAPGF